MTVHCLKTDDAYTDPAFALTLLLTPRVHDISVDEGVCSSPLHKFKDVHVQTVKGLQLAASGFAW